MNPKWKVGKIFSAFVGGLIKELGDYNATDWPLFIGSSNPSWKCVLLNNGNLYDSYLDLYGNIIELGSL